MTLNVDYPEMWAPLVERRMQDFEMVVRFIGQKKDVIPFALRASIFQMGRQALKEVHDFGVSGWTIQDIKSKVQPTAAWAHALEVATNNMRDEILANFPDLYADLPSCAKADHNRGG